MNEFPDRNLDVLNQRTASGQKQFIPLIETNENEGETWRFWLQVLGNENELRKLWAMIDAADKDDEYFPYSLADLDADGTTPESEVDLLIKHDVGMTTYMAAEHKVTGQFRCPDDLVSALYKGGIKELFTG